MNMNFLQTTCNNQQVQQILDSIKNKTINAEIVIKLPSVSVYIGDGWYEVSTVGTYILVYINKSDPSYNYTITVIKTPFVTLDCNGIVISKNNKDGTSAPDNTLPQSVIDSAITSFPTSTSCGTGIWNGCIAGIQNKYLIAGGGLAAGIYLYMKSK